MSQATNTNKIPATIVTGFLGAGKTTIIRQLLEQANGKRIALIINEFGDVGVDGDILKGCGSEVCTEDDIVELANGCICCTVADDFLPTMTALLERENAPDQIVIETSGLALPQPLVKAFSWPTIRERVSVDGVVTVVDTPAVAEGRFAANEAAVQAQREADEALDHESPLHELFEDQLVCADIVLLNKSDLVDEATLKDVKHHLEHEVRKGVPFVTTCEGDVKAASILNLASAAEDDMENRKSHHEAHGHDDHDHDDFDSFVIALDGPQNRDVLLGKIKDTITKHDVLRLKGFASIDGADARLTIQAAGPRINTHFDRPWNAGEMRGTSLVVIGLSGMDEAAIRAELSGLSSLAA